MPFPAGETSKSSDCRGRTGRKSGHRRRRSRTTAVPARLPLRRSRGRRQRRLQARNSTYPVTFSPFFAQGLPRTAAKNPASAARVRATATRAVGRASRSVLLFRTVRSLLRPNLSSLRGAGGPFVRRRGRLQASRLVARRRGGAALTPPLPPHEASASSRRGVADGKAPRPSVASAHPCPVPVRNFPRPPGSERLPPITPQPNAYHDMLTS